MDLAFDLGRVYGVADVLDRGVPDQAERPGLAVDAHPRDVDREHRRGGLHRRAAGRLDGPVPAHELGAQPDQLCDLDRSTRRPFHRDVSADDVEVFGRSLELLGGDLEELPAGLACRFKYRAADAVGDLAAARGWAKGRGRGVAGFDPHHVRRDPERFGRDHREPGRGAADIGRAHHHRDRSVWLHPTSRRGRRAGAAPRAQGHAHGLIGAKRGRVYRVPPGLLEDLDRSDPRPALAVRSGVAFARDVGEPELDRVHLEHGRQLIHRRLEGEVGLCRTRRAVGVGRGLVGRDLEPAQVEVRDPVGAAQEARGQPRVPTRAGSVVVVEAHPQRDERAVTPGAELEVELRGGCGVADHELVRPAQGEAHRPPQTNGEQRQQRFEQRDLAAKSAAHRHCDDAHLVRGQVDEPRHRVAHDKRALGRRPDGQSAVRLRPGNRDVGLHERLVRARDPVRPLDNDVCGLERGIGVTAPEVRHAADVARPCVGRTISRGRGAMERSILAIGSVRVAEHERRLVHHCRDRVDRRRRLVVIDLDQRRGVGGR